MLKIRRLYILSAILLLLAGVLVILFPFAGRFLAVDQTIDSKVVVLEGWLHESVIGQIIEEYPLNEADLIFTSGQISEEPEYFVHHSDGFLIMHTTEFNDESGDFSINFIAGGSPCEQEYPEFSLYINDSLVNTWQTGKKSIPYSWTHTGRVDSVMIEFTNDAWTKAEDRNLYVRDIQFNGQAYSLYENLSYYVKYLHKDKMVRIVPGSPSMADAAKKTLIDLGFDEDKIIAVPSKRVEKFRTWQSAVCLKKWMIQNDIVVENFNVISQGTHARRSWLAYRKAFGLTKKEVGIVSAGPSELFLEKFEEDPLCVEFLDYLLYRFYLPFSKYAD